MIPFLNRLPTKQASGAIDTLSGFFSKEPGRSLSRDHSSLLPAVTNGPSTPSFCLQNACLPPLNSGDALRKKTSEPRIRAEMLDGWKGVEGIIKACPTFLEIIRIELTNHCGIEKTRELVARKLSRLAVATNTYLSQGGHQLRFDLCYHRPADLMEGIYQWVSRRDLH